MATTTRKASKQPKELISAAAIFAVTDKVTGDFLGFGVPSSDPSHKPYEVTWNAERLCWQCTCRGNAEFHRHCKHIKAVEEVCCARKEQAAACPCPCEGACPVVATTPAKREEIAAIFVSAAHEAQPRVEYSFDIDFGYCQPMYRMNGGEWQCFTGCDGHPVVIDGVQTCKEWLRIVEESSQIEADLWLEQQYRANAGFVSDGAAAYGDRLREESRRREEAPLNNSNRGFSLLRR